MEVPGIPFEIGKIITGKDNRRVFVADVVYSVVESTWLVIYHSVTEDDKVGGTFTLSLEVFCAGL